MCSENGALSLAPVVNQSAALSGLITDTWGEEVRLLHSMESSGYPDDCCTSENVFSFSVHAITLVALGPPLASSQGWREPRMKAKTEQKGAFDEEEKPLFLSWTPTQDCVGCLSG